MRSQTVLLLLWLVCNPCVAAAADEVLHAVGRFPEQAVDADHDGVADIDDNCPNTAPTSLVRGKRRPTVVDLCGCPIDPCGIDTDKDGINDCDDLCPGTARGLRVGPTGCPLPQKKPQTFVLNLKFQFAVANLQDQYVPDLERLRLLLVRLPELRVTLEGHTDARGSVAYNQALSQARAEKCRKYLLTDLRIAPARVRAIGYGKSQPVASNVDDSGRAQNRRTVATLSYLYEFTPANDGSGLPP